MKITLELKDQKKRLAKIELESEKGISDFRRMTNSLFSIVHGEKEPKEDLSQEYLEELEKIKKEFCHGVKQEKKEKRGEAKKPEIIHDEVVLSMEEQYEEAIKNGEKPDTYINDDAYKEALQSQEVSTLKYGREIFLFTKCPKCQSEKFYKTSEGSTFHCDCGYEQLVENPVFAGGNCPNCNSTFTIRTLKGMDISYGYNCRRCKSPIDLFFNEKKRIWLNE